MEVDKLKLLISQNENAKLEFKEQWYHKSQKNEMIKDIIALANGNPQTVGEEAYLIIGVEDKTKNIKGVNLLKSIAELEQEVLQNINNYATPPITDISFDDSFNINGKKILVITIPTHNYLVYLSKDLQTKRRTERRNSAFYREGEMISIASPDIVREFDKQYKILDRLDEYEIKSDRDDIVEIDGLMYQNDILTRDYTYEEAEDYAQRLRLGGYRDWRLPTPEELLILATDSEIEISYKKVYIRNEFAQNISNKSYAKFWTSDEEYVEYIDKSFFGFKKEFISYYTACTISFNSPKSSFISSSLFSHSNQNNKNYVICVREKE
jgi:hypothetical protein